MCQQWIKTAALLLLAAVLPGCIILDRVARPDEIAPLRSILVVAVESPPVVLSPAIIEAFGSISSETGGGGAWLGGPGAGAIGIVVITYNLVVRLPKEIKIKAEMMELLKSWRAGQPPWSATLVLSDLAAELVSADLHITVDTLPDQLKLPEMRQREPSFLVENWASPLRQWYDRETSLADLAEIRRRGADAVLEVGCWPVEVSREYVVVHVATKLIDAAGGRVIARATAAELVKSVPLEQLFRDSGRTFETLFSTSGKKVLDTTLRKMGLIR